MLSHSFLPESYPHRSNQMENIGSIMANVLRNHRPSNMFLYGKPGTGKTCVTKFVLQKLQAHIFLKQTHLQSKFFYSYINCKEIGATNYSVYQNIIQSLDTTKSVPPTGLPTSEVYQRLIQTFESLGKCIIVLILDEIDELVKKSGSEVLYSLTRINDSLKETQVAIIGISNDTKFKDYLDPRAYSSLSEEEIIFSPYNAIELIDILNERSILALHENVLEQGVIQKIAAIAAREHGDARRALDLLRVSAELAERQGYSTITSKLVTEAKNHIEKNTVQEVISTLPQQSKLVIAAIYRLEELEKVDEITSGMIYDLYEDLCEKIKFDKVSSRRISDYINELDVLGILEANVVSKGRYGRTKKVKFCIPKSIVYDLLNKDTLFSQLIN
jgi:cell division control protein 6